METIIFDAVARVLGRIHLNMSLKSERRWITDLLTEKLYLCCVKHVGDSNSLEIIDVADGVPIADDNSVENFVTVNSQMSSLVVITG